MSGAHFDPGWLRHRVVIEAPAASPDGAGGETVTWSTVDTVWAKMDSPRAIERIATDRLTGVVTHVATLRFRNDVTGGMRLVYRGRPYRVLTAHDPDLNERYLVVKVEVEMP